MQEQFIPYELALELKELGFDEECFGYYYPDAYSTKTILCDSAININHTYYNEFPDRGDAYSTDNFNEQFVSAPLWQQAFDWFRNEHKLLSGIATYSKKFVEEHRLCEQFEPQISDENECIWSQGYNDYKEARLKTLEKLIEIVQQNNV